jgi:hypothetical protein
MRIDRRICSRKVVIDQFKLTPQDFTVMAVAHGSTTEFVRARTKKPIAFKKTVTIYDVLKTDPYPNIDAMVDQELAARLPQIDLKCKCGPQLSAVRLSIQLVCPENWIQAS